MGNSEQVAENELWREGPWLDEAEKPYWENLIFKMEKPEQYRAKVAAEWERVTRGREVARASVEESCPGLFTFDPSASLMLHISMYTKTLKEIAREIECGAPTPTLCEGGYEATNLFDPEESTENRIYKYMPPEGRKNHPLATCDANNIRRIETLCGFEERKEVAAACGIATSTYSDLANKKIPITTHNAKKMVRGMAQHALDNGAFLAFNGWRLIVNAMVRGIEIDDRVKRHARAVTEDWLVIYLLSEDYNGRDAIDMTSLTIEELFDLESDRSKGEQIFGFMGFADKETRKSLQKMLENGLKARYPNEESRPAGLARVLGGGW